MATFFVNGNNGVKAVIREDHAKIYETILSAGGDPRKVGVKIFTFCSSERFEGDDKYIFTGSYADLDELIRKGGHHLTANFTGWSGYVPFSNGAELGIHGEEAQNDELKYRTCLKDVMETFDAEAVIGKAA